MNKNYTFDFDFRDFFNFILVYWELLYFSKQSTRKDLISIGTFILSSFTISELYVPISLSFVTKQSVSHISLFKSFPPDASSLLFHSPRDTLRFPTIATAKPFTHCASIYFLNWFRVFFFVLGTSIVCEEFGSASFLCFPH
jgi:hypothetical protein